MIINCSFSGCSCGCTPSESASFEGEDPDIYVAIAEWAQDYIVYGEGEKIFRKLTIPQQSKEILLKTTALSKNIKDLEHYKSILEKEREIIMRAAGTLEVEIPDNKKVKIAADKETIRLYDEKIKSFMDEKSSLFRHDRGHKVIDEE